MARNTVMIAVASRIARFQLMARRVTESVADDAAVFVADLAAALPANRLVIVVFLVVGRAKLAVFA
jgi:hypothetical protein